MLVDGKPSGVERREFWVSTGQFTVTDWILEVILLNLGVLVSLQWGRAVILQAVSAKDQVNDITGLVLALRLVVLASCRWSCSRLVLCIDGFCLDKIDLHNYLRQSHSD